MQKYLPIVLGILLLWGSSCDHDESRHQQVSTKKKITVTDLEHEPAVKDLLFKIQGSSANGRISSLEIADAFFKYSEPDSGILNYTFRLPDESPDYFENLVLSQYEDGFYGFIYRYIPDGPYIAGDSFKGTFQQYNLTGELILQFTTSAMPDSVSAGGRVQLLNQCVKSIDQTCTTIYEVETRTDYPCHCQYDHKTVVSSVCTFSFNRGWCDDMIAIPPAGGGGTYIGASDATPRSGGAGGSTATPKPVKKNPVVVVPPNDDDIIYDKVKSPCLRTIIKKLISKDLTNDINKATLNIFETKQNINLIFEEDANLGDKPGRTIAKSINGSFNVTIWLNPNLANSSSEYVASVVYHEAMHAYLNANTTISAELEQHVEMAENYIGWLNDALREIHPGLSNKNATALALRGLSNVMKNNPSYWDDLIKSLGFTNTAEVVSVTDGYRNGTDGTTCF